MVKIRICPKCKSINLEKEPTRGMYAIAGIRPIFTCKDCGFSGSIFPEIDIEKLKNMKNANNNLKQERN